MVAGPDACRHRARRHRSGASSGTVGDAAPLRQVFDWLCENGGLHDTSGDFSAALATMYATVHGADIDEDELQHALSTGAAFLEIVRATSNDWC